MKLNKNIWFGALTIILLVLIGFFVLSNNSIVTSNEIVAKNEIQIVKLSVENGQYIMSPSTLKKDVPVRIEADMSKMPGCSKSIVIPTFNVRKSLSESDNIIEFTPNKAGTFNIACSMNMYKGTFTVLESDGTKPNYIDQQPSQASTSRCGMAGGSCGCGG